MYYYYLPYFCKLSPALSTFHLMYLVLYRDDRWSHTNGSAGVAAINHKMEIKISAVKSFLEWICRYVAEPGVIT